MERWLLSMLLVVALGAVGCDDSPTGDDAGAGMDSGAAMMDSGPSGTDSGPGNVDSGNAGRDGGEPSDAGPVVCRGTVCDPGLVCCFTSGTCYDPAMPQLCMDPTGDAGNIAPCTPPCMTGQLCCIRNGMCCTPGDLTCCPME